MFVFLSVLVGGLSALFVPWHEAFLWYVIPFAVFGFLFAISLSCIRSKPVVSVWLGLSGFGLVFVTSAAAVYGGVVLAGVVPEWVANIAPENVDAETVKKVAGTLSGAVATLIGALWLDNAKSIEGSYWPAGMYKHQLGKVYAGADIFNVPLDGMRPAKVERLYSIIYDTRLYDNSINGWGFWARLARARGVRDLDPT